MSTNRFPGNNAIETNSTDPRSREEPTTGLTRRRFLQGVGAATVGLLTTPAILQGGRAGEAEASSGLFSLGVASGDPGFHSVVLWTRLAPDPLNGGGMPNRPVDVKWEVATDAGMRNIVRQGAAATLARDGHTVHVLVAGLPSDRWFFYRFQALGAASRVGRTRTFPHPRDGVNRLRFALASCQDLREGFYPAYRDMAEQNLDFVIHVGDYIYENGPTDVPIAEGRNHNGPEIVSVDDYRNRYALYRLDPDLQDAHALFPFIVTWDDHEVDNNYAGFIPEESSPTQGQEFITRRRNAYQVYAEMMPLRPRNRLLGRDSRLVLFRRMRYGDLADIHVLDTRQFRTDQAAEDGFGSTDPDSRLVEGAFGEQLFDADGILDPNGQMLGVRQDAWLARGLERSRATWNVLAQQVMVTEWNLVEAARQTIAGNPQIPGPSRDAILQALANVENFFNVDAWDGYQAARRRLFDILARVRPKNPIVLTGDIHSAWGANLLRDFSDPNSDILAAEFVCTSISSTFLARDPRPTDAVVRASVVADNPHIEFFNGLFRGYCICDVNRRRWRTTYRAVGALEAINSPDPNAFIPFPNALVETDAILEIEADFNEPGRGARIETRFARWPLAR